jgi:hypothetical protein
MTAQRRHRDSFRFRVSALARTAVIITSRLHIAHRVVGDAMAFDPGVIAVSLSATMDEHCARIAVQHGQ